MLAKLSVEKNEDAMLSLVSQPPASWGWHEQEEKLEAMCDRQAVAEHVDVNATESAQAKIAEEPETREANGRKSKSTPSTNTSSPKPNNAKMNVFKRILAKNS